MGAVTGIKSLVEVAGWSASRAPEVWIEHERGRPIGRAGCTLPDPKGELFQTVERDAPIQITLGYRDEKAETWKGTVQSCKHGGGKNGDQVEILACGESRPLSTKIKQSWRNETPEAILKYCIGQAGLPMGTLMQTGVTLPHFSAASIPVWQVAEQLMQTLKRGYGRAMNSVALWLGRDGVQWGDHDEPDGESGRARIETGEGLISHWPANDQAGRSGCEAFLMPGLRHSQKVFIRDARRGISGEKKVLRCRHQVRALKGRTFVEFGDEYERY